MARERSFRVQNCSERLGSLNNFISCMGGEFEGEILSLHNGPIRARVELIWSTWSPAATLQT